MIQCLLAPDESDGDNSKLGFDDGDNDYLKEDEEEIFESVEEFGQLTVQQLRFKLVEQGMKTGGKRMN